MVWAPPMPLGWIIALFKGKVPWSAVAKGINPAFSLAFLYLIRSSLHGAALKRNVSNIQRIAKAHDNRPPCSPNGPGRRRSFSEPVDIECNVATSSLSSDTLLIEKAKSTNIALVSPVTFYLIYWFTNDLISV